MSTAVEMSIGPARLGQVESIAHVWYDGWRDGHLGHVPPGLIAHRTSVEFERRAGDRLGDTMVATAGNSPDVVGFVVVRGDEVEQLYVSARSRGSGIAARLLATAETRISARHSVAWLAVVAGNTRARRFYERGGWTDKGAIDNNAEISGGRSMLVPARRYEKHLRSGGAVR